MFYLILNSLNIEFINKKLILRNYKIAKILFTVLKIEYNNKKNFIAKTLNKYKKIFLKYIPHFIKIIRFCIW